MTEEYFNNLKLIIHEARYNPSLHTEYKAIKKKANRLRNVIHFYKNVILKQGRTIDSMEENLVNTSFFVERMKENIDKLNNAKEAFKNYNPTVK